MKTKILLNVALSSLIASAPAMAADNNPFAEGTGRPVLNQQVVKAVLEYGDTSKAALGRALSEAQGKSLSEANGIYLEAIMKVVVKSYANKYYTELLFRQILNQALLLTYGTPTADGKGIQKQGLLKNISNQDLLTVILEDSIRLAIDVYNDDRSAILSGRFSDGAINAVALKQLELTREWMASVMEFEGAMHALGVMGVQSFLQTINHDDNMQVNLIAEEIQDATEILDKHEGIKSNDPKMPGYIRVLRGKLHKLRDNMNKKMHNIKYDSSLGRSEHKNNNLGSPIPGTKYYVNQRIYALDTKYNPHSGNIIAYSSEKKQFVIKFDNHSDPSSGWVSEELHIVSGCSYGHCVDDIVHVTRDDGRYNNSAKIVALNQEKGTYILEFVTGSLMGQIGGGWKARNLTKTK